MYKDRHVRVEVMCGNCSTLFMARVEQVNKGQGKFCSLQCANEYQRKIASNGYGFENGKKYFSGGKWIVTWYDERGQHNTSYPKWWWITNKGEIPVGYVISLIDKNPENIDPNNFECIPKGKIWAQNGKGNKARTGMKWTIKQRLDISKRMLKAWVDGKHNGHLKENHPHWRGGSKKIYPKEFYDIRDFILDRDEYTCQICGKRLDNPKFTHVHHRDGNKQHNKQENLISLCIHCHGKVHAHNKTSPAILSLRSELEWNS